MPSCQSYDKKKSKAGGRAGEQKHARDSFRQRRQVVGEHLPVCQRWPVQ